MSFDFPIEKIETEDEVGSEKPPPEDDATVREKLDLIELEFAKKSLQQCQSRLDIKSAALEIG